MFIILVLSSISMQSWGSAVYVKARVKVYGEAGMLSDTALVDMGATGIIADESIVEELGLRVFGRVRVATLGMAIECHLADVKNVVIEDTEIGPRRIAVCRFPREVRERLRSLGCSEKMILGVSAIEDAGYIPNTAKGVLERVGFLAV